MQPNSSLVLRNFYAQEMHFSLTANNNKATQENKNYEIKPIFQRFITKTSNREFLATLIFEITQNDELPFNCRVVLIGEYYLEDWENSKYESVVKINTIAILFPYLRQILTSITSSANIAPLVLPIANVAALFE